jgi:hypothetical protein
MKQRELDSTLSRLNDVYETTNLQGRYNHLIATSDLKLLLLTCSQRKIRM